MRAPADAIVAGGGIAGLTVALALAARGRRVLLLDAARPGAASRASAGMLAAGFGFAGAVAPLAVAAREHYPPFLAALLERTGVDVPLDRRGILELAGDDAGLARRRVEAGVAAKVLDAPALARLEPALGRHAGALLHARDGAVDVRLLMAALDRCVELEPRIVRHAACAARVEPVRMDAVVRTVDGARHEAARVVIATGAWLDGMTLPGPIPVRPVHGELLRLAHAPPGHVVYGAGGYLIPRDGGVLVGATSEDTGHAVRTSEAGRRALLAIAERTVPGLGAAPVLEHWAGLRPVSPDGLPILGVDPAHPALACACGYSRNGILFAPWAAERLAAVLDGEEAPELAPFAPGRFAPAAGIPGA